jgi:superfamily II DNA or RNA helicase
LRTLLQRAHNTLALYPVPPGSRDAIEEALTYECIETLRGEDAAMARSLKLPITRVEERACYEYDRMGRLCFPIGYQELVEKILKRGRHRVRHKDLRPHPRPEIFEPHFDYIYENFRLRHKQEELLYVLATNERARIDCPTGFGKSFMIGLAALMWPHAKIDALVPGLDLLHRMHRELSSQIPGVGRIGGTRHDQNTLVTVVSADSLHKVKGDADVLFIDEAHEFATDVRLAQLARYRRARAYGFSASHNARIDQRDFELMSLLGPVRLSVPYGEAVDHDMVVPITVMWVSDREAPRVAAGMRGVARSRWAVWNNVRRNRLIARVSKCFHPQDQQLITVRTLEHAVNIKRYLPGHTLVYDDKSMDDKRRKMWVASGALQEDEPQMTPDRREHLRDQFERGKLKRVIATTVWNRGVDFKRLAVLLRGDAGASTVSNIQIPGRLSRTFRSKTLEKTGAILVDFEDECNSDLKSYGVKRRTDYEAKGWKQMRFRRPKRTWRRK